MSAIRYNLFNSVNLAGMAPPTLPGGGFGNAALPLAMAMAGSYIIVNTTTNNRYIGISSNIYNRFNTRLATVTEMGFGTNTMAAIGATWGATSCQDTPTALVPAPAWVQVDPNPPAAFNAVVDGAIVNLEWLLIRFVITQLGAGGTVSNNSIAGAYTNPTGNAVTVQLDWGTMGGLFTAGSQASVWGIGVAW